MTDDAPSGEVTRLLRAAASGNQKALGEVYTLLYPQLKSMAHRRVRNVPVGVALDTTSLVHESYLRLAKRDELALEDRRHFIAFASHVMRSVVVDFVRQFRAQRRGGDLAQVTLNTAIANSIETSDGEILRLDQLLDELAAIDSRLVAVVEMRYFAAMETPQIAELLQVNERTVRRDLEKVRLLLMDDRRND